MKLSVVKTSFKNVAGEYLQVTTVKENNYLQVSVCKEKKKPLIGGLCNFKQFWLLLLPSFLFILAYTELNVFYKLVIIATPSLYCLQTLRKTVTKESILVIRSMSSDSLQYSKFYLFGRQSTRYLPAGELAICETLRFNSIIYNLMVIGARQPRSTASDSNELSQQQQRQPTNSNTTRNRDNVVLLKASLPRLDCLKYIYNQIKEFQRDSTPLNRKEMQT